MRNDDCTGLSQRLAALVIVCLTSTSARGADPIKTLIIDGNNPYHVWQETTPLLTEVLQRDGLCEVSVMTAPQDPAAMEAFRPRFDKFDLVVGNYVGLAWNDATQSAFEQFVAGGGGYVSVHAANNAFPHWPAYNRMTGLGGWGERSEKDGPYVRWKDDRRRFTRDMSAGNGGEHGTRVPFLIIVRDGDHPITRGIPSSFYQVADELYAKLRGPAENLHVLATAFADPASGGTGEHEPILMTIPFGSGRVFHTTLGHDLTAMNGAAFQVTLRRGAQWAATGDVTLPDVTADVLSADTPLTMAASAAPAAPIDHDTIPDIDRDDWVSIFNGTDLTGWSPKNGTAMYRVQDAAVIGKTAEGSPNSFLCTDKLYRDFELTFEVKCDPGLNSGVQIRSATKPDGGRVFGPQVEIETAPGEAGYLYGEATGRDWLTKDRTIHDAYQNDRWNRYVVRAHGDRIQTWINGVAIADLVDVESNRPGFIGLQVHSIAPGSGPLEVRWRDLRIRELPR